MRVLVKLGLFILVLAAAFGVGAAVGAAVPDLSGGDDGPADHSDVDDGRGEHP
jgi:hypothetical protein